MKKNEENWGRKVRTKFQTIGATLINTMANKIRQSKA